MKGEGRSVWLVVSTILIVEDEPAIAESLAFALKRDGFDVRATSRIREAREQLAEVNLVILDLMLPDGSGFDILTEARQLEQPPSIIVLSSRDHEADRVAALETGADDYVTKPFSPREMVARVRAVLRRFARAAASGTEGLPPGARAVALPLLVDEASRQATVAGQPVDLTRVEFDLLSCLLASPGRVFTRAQLIDKVWGDGFAITDRTVDSHVKALRRKVGDAGGDPGWIETVRGVGYRVRDASSDDSAPGGD